MRHQSTVKCYLVAFFLTFGGPGFAQQRVANHQLFHFRNTQLQDVLAMSGAFYRVRVCNLKQLRGVPVEGTLSKSEPLGNIIKSISFVEAGHVFLVYQKGVIYVDRRPFAAAFIPEKNEWPCAFLK
ncbi:MAG TPA: hypothetical protein VHE34_06345 [Puia sp.]|uniref:hypothetical protein n=1 Tax=Puia sp. TaxID=2045100 RepID=UPI002B96705E|nr:hypothetical protein [Puia sp.]HVU94824.1 hypothetical protein [Puia sp.]